MHGKLKTEKLIYAWSRLEALTPLIHDCGAYCGAACCEADDDLGGGMFLFPGEDNLIGAAPWARIERVTMPCFGAVQMLTCDGKCDRSRRPLGCRIFPLTPIFRKDRRIDVKIDRRAWAVCPLAGHGVAGLNPAFVTAVREALGKIASDPEGLDFLRKWAQLEALFRQQSLLS